METYVQHYADSLGISLNVSYETIPIGDPYYPLAIIYVMDFHFAQLELSPHASGFGTGFMVTDAYNGLDVSRPPDLMGPGLFIHELGHATFGFTDHYPPFGRSGNQYDVMSTGAWNNDGWTVPHYASPDAHRNQWWPVTALDNGDDLGFHYLPVDHTLYCSNPFYEPDRPERLYFTPKKDTLGDAGIGFSGTGLAVWHTFVYTTYDSINQRSFTNLTVEMIAADSTIAETPDGNLYPHLGIDSVQVNYWLQTVNEDSIPVSFVLDELDTTTTGDTMSLTVNYVANPSLFAVSGQPLSPPHIGELWYPQIPVRNLGLDADTLVVTVLSGRPDIIPEFILYSTGSIGTLGYDFLTSPVTVEISSDQVNLGALIPLIFEFPENTDTMFVSLQIGLDTSAQFDDFTGPRVYNANGSTVVVASAPYTVSAYVNDVYEWSSIMGHTPRAIAINLDTSRVAVATMDNYVYQLDASDGTVLDVWHPSADLADPAVMYTNEFLCFVAGDSLYRYDANGDPPSFAPDGPTSLPLLPDAYCFADDRGVMRFAMTAGDSASGSDGVFVILDSIGGLIYPTGPFIPVSGTEAFLLPLAGDHDADGHVDFFAPYTTSNGRGGYAVIARIFGTNNLSMTLNGFSFLPNAWNFAFSFTTALPFFSARLVSSWINPTGPFSNRIHYDDSNLLQMSWATNWFVSSIDYDNSGQNLVFVARPDSTHFSFYNHLAVSYYEGATPIAAETTPNLICGPPITHYNSNLNQWNLAVPVELESGWTLKSYQIYGDSSDWQGQHGNGQNTRSHWFRGTGPECPGPDTLSLTCKVADGNLRLYWTACFDATILGYRVYRATSFGDTRTEVTGLEIHDEDAPLIWTEIPVSSLSEIAFYDVTAILEE